MCERRAQVEHSRIAQMLLGEQCSLWQKAQGLARQGGLKTPLFLLC